MIYFRVAIQKDETMKWEWQSTPLTSLHATIGFLRMYERVAKKRIRIFFSSSQDILEEMMHCENEGSASNSVTSIQFYQAKMKIDTTEMIRLEAELGNRTVTEKQLVEKNGRTYDTAYRFTLPTSTREILAWIRLLTQVQRGVLLP